MEEKLCISQNPEGSIGSGGEWPFLDYLSKNPAGTRRVLAVLAAVFFVAWLGVRLGRPVDWETAIVYGTALGLSMRWPVILPRTGIRLTFLGGMIFEAIWTHGLLTAVAVLLIDFGTRAAVPVGHRGNWQWYRPFVVLASVLGAYTISNWVSGGVVPRTDVLLPPTNTYAVVQSFAFWLLLTAGYAFLTGPLHQRSKVQEYMIRMGQVWWVPLLFLAQAWGLELVRGYVPFLFIPSALLFIGVQARLGPVFTQIYQDQTVAELLRSTMPKSQAQRAVYQRVFRYAHALSRDLRLPDEDIRIVGYAAFLQEHLVDADPLVPLWLSRKPTSEELPRLEAHVAQAVGQVERVGALEDVVRLIRCRYAAYDGEGYPAISGEEIPLGAQVLAAANAVAALTIGDGTAGVTSAAAAVTWIRANAASRFHPMVIAAMVRVFVERNSLREADAALPDTVRQLQGLVTSTRSSTVRAGLRRIWNQLRGQTGLAPELPEEVLAVARMASFFASSSGTAETAQIAVRAVGELLGAKVVLALNDGAEDPLEMRFRAAHGITNLNLVGRLTAVQAGMMSRAIMNQESFQVGDLTEMTSSLAHEIARTEGIRSVLFVPLVGRHRTTGLMIVGMPRYHWFTPREVGLINLMAGQAAAALENAYLMDEVARRLDHISALKSFTDTLLDNLTTSIVVVDPEGQLSLANAAARTLCGADYPLVAGQPLPEGVVRVFPVHRALAGETVPEFDVPWGQAILEVGAAPLRDAAGTLLGAVCTARDVTRVRTMEQQVRRVEKLAAIGELAAGAAHEIRNPLTSIRGFIQLAQAKAAAREGEFFQIVLNEIDRIDAIIRDLLLLARPAEIYKVPVSPKALLEEVLALHRSDLDRKGIQVQADYDPSLSVIQADPKMLRQVLLNLIINATQAMPQGGTLGVAVYQSSETQIALEVSDTGCGIPPENLPRLFDPFFTTKEEGTGLGLPLCHSIVQAHGGEIDVRSTLGKGTLFTVVFPVQ